LFTLPTVKAAIFILVGAVTIVVVIAGPFALAVDEPNIRYFQAISAVIPLLLLTCVTSQARTREGLDDRRRRVADAEVELASVGHTMENTLFWRIEKIWRRLLALNVVGACALGGVGEWIALSALAEGEGSSTAMGATLMVAASMLLQIASAEVLLMFPPPPPRPSPPAEPAPAAPPPDPEP
jgi:uncharacterized membrane protein YraQ (UPF0718 family)